MYITVSQTGTIKIASMKLGNQSYQAITSLGK